MNKRKPTTKYFALVYYNTVVSAYYEKLWDLLDSIKTLKEYESINLGKFDKNKKLIETVVLYRGEDY